MESDYWRKNLYAIFISEFIVLVGFQFIIPFLPLYAQKLGNFTPREAAFWAGIATGLSGIAMFLSAPLWGILADRWGRKPMVLRAQLGSAVVIALTALAPNVYILVLLRFINGLLSGTVSAASALVSAGTPRENRTSAMALIMVATFSGTAFGPLIGGILADSLGYRTTFFLTSSFLLAGGMIVLFFVKESFDRPLRGQGASLRSTLKLANSKDMLALLLALVILPLGTQIIAPNISLFIEKLEPGGRSATASGLSFCLMGVLAAISAIIAGRLGGRISLKKMLVFSCLGSGLLTLPPIWAGTVGQLIIFIAMTGIFKGGIMTSVNSLVGLLASSSQQGSIYGIAQSAQSLGNGIGPLIGGPLASMIGFRYVFGVAAALFGLVALYVQRTLHWAEKDKT